MPLDERLYRFVYGGDASTTFSSVMLVLTWIGNGWSMLALVPLLFVRRSRRFAATLLGALVVQSLVVWALKRIVERARPYIVLGTHPTYGPPTDYSFPSGHASGSFTVAAFVVVVCMSTPTLPGRHAIALVTVLLAIGVATSRVYLGVHYPSDVAFGALLGGAIGAGAARRHCAHRTPAL